MSSSLKYGLLTAAGLIGWMLGEYALGLHTTHVAYSRYTGWVTELILLIGLWRMLLHQLHLGNRYWLPLWVGLLQGLLTCLVVGMGYYIFLSAYLRFLNPVFPYYYLEWSVAQMRSHGVSEEDIRLKSQAFLWTFSPTGMLINTIGFKLLVGFFAAPIITLWLNWRRKEIQPLN